MIIFACFTAVVLLLILLGLKIQGLQKQLRLNQGTLKVNTRRMNEVNSSLVVLSQQLQTFLLERLESSHKRKLVDPNTYKTLLPLFENIDTISNLYALKGMTIEEILKTVLQDTEGPLEEVREIIKLQPSNVRLAWSKNTLDGLLSACTSISGPTIKTEEKATPDS